MALATGGTGAAETFTYTTPDGYILTLEKVDASHLKVRKALNGQTGISVDQQMNADFVPAAQTYASLSATVTAISTTEATLRLLPGTYTVSSDLTIPANCTLKMERGAVLAVADNKTLTINGPVEAGPYQIFSDSNTDYDGVVISKAQVVYPQWWGAAGDNSTNDLAAFSRCYRSLTNGGVIRLINTGNNYLISGGHIASNSKTTWEGVGLPTIRQSTNYWILAIPGGVYDVTVKGIRFLQDTGIAGLDKGCIGYIQSGTSNGGRIDIRDCQFVLGTGRTEAVSMSATAGFSGKPYINIENLYIDATNCNSNYAHGLYLINVQQCNIKGIRVYGPTTPLTNAGNGIKVIGDDSLSYDISVSECYVKSMHVGLYVSTQTGFTTAPKRVSILNNKYDNCVVAHTIGSVVNLTDIGNQCLGGADSRDGYQYSSVSEAIIANNLVRDLPTDGYYGFNYGSCNNVRSHSHQIIDCKRGVRLSDASNTKLFLYSHTIRNESAAGAHGFSMSDTTGKIEVFVYDNTILGYTNPFYYVDEDCWCWGNRFSTTNVIPNNATPSVLFSTLTIAAASVDGKMKSTTSGYYQINGAVARHTAVDNKWDLTALTTGAGEYAKVALCLNIAGTASVVKGTVAATQAAALIPKVNENLCVIGVVELGPNYAGGALGAMTFYDTVGYSQPY